MIYIHLDHYPVRTCMKLHTVFMRCLNLRIFTEAEIVRKEEALYLRFFMQELKSRKFWIALHKCHLHITMLCLY